MKSFNKMRINIQYQQEVPIMILKKENITTRYKKPQSQPSN
ncbi:hypothetical protein [Staphylococcus aureus]|nr:hypothetical protein [Staphylococcus aureus]